MGGGGGGITKVGVGGSKKDGVGEGWFTNGRRFFFIAKLYTPPVQL